MEHPHDIVTRMGKGRQLLAQLVEIGALDVTTVEREEAVAELVRLARHMSPEERTRVVNGARSLQRILAALVVALGRDRGAVK